MEAISELFDFLTDLKPEVRRIAVEQVLTFSNTPEYVPLFLADDMKAIKYLKLLVNDTPLIAQSALSSLINLSSKVELAAQMTDERFLADIIKIILNTESPNSDIACMLLSNLSKSEIVADKLLPRADLDDSTKLRTEFTTIGKLVDVFVRGESNKLNKFANYDHLSGVFANITKLPQGRKHFLRNVEDSEYNCLLGNIICFTEHPSLLRRGGVISTIKNCCFNIEAHENMLDPDGLNLLPRILLPLAGPEDFNDEEMEALPDELQLLEPTKKRESDSYMRELLIESLILLATTKFGRDYLRNHSVYPIIREMDLQETDDRVHELALKYVNMTMRPEDPNEKEDLSKHTEYVKTKHLEEEEEEVEVVDELD
ncbi:hypothetical protein H8356DRAFT_1639848 [Neocallimastix lanati (nom. inval.)]|jgi:hypothetical protein|uniref:Protein HGH1 homolog n=1 Tax=Neocallimastix californiae TaxID=1754190 RepID=A0A1Y2A8P9_9FUNG|nr:hypothetical protein H8356DRAFT_1639848 [Neocallimastix sp. JGI-2020a]ORY18903.1 DUF383-domain-containing protein [Neocallimastix californiae]|eukprot:ORY18903.1 DUF383-domain-containing protein [Neocallimastix californiae]